MAQLILPPLSIPSAVRQGSITVNTVYSNIASIWNGSAIKFNATIDITAVGGVAYGFGAVQVNSSQDTTPVMFEYNGLNVEVGMWIGLPNGMTYKIVQIISQTANVVECVLEDVDLYCLLVDNTGQGNNIPVDGENGLIFRLSDDGIPVLAPTELFRNNLGETANWLNDLHDRFRLRNYLTDFFAIDIDAAIYGGFSEGDFVKINSSGQFVKVTTNTQADILSIAGIVTSVNTPSDGNMRVRPVGRIVTGLTLSGLGNTGDILYFDPSQPNNLTVTQPVNTFYAVYIKINDTTAIMLAKSSGGGGSSIYLGASPSTITVGGMPAGTNIYGMTFQAIDQTILVPYIHPSFTSFGVNISSVLEVGTALSGLKNFSWSFSNQANVTPNTLNIIDLTTSTTLASNISINSPASVNIGTITNNSYTSHTWQVRATDTQSTQFSANTSIVWEWMKWWGISAFQTLSGNPSDPNYINVLSNAVLAASFAQTYNFAAGLYKFWVWDDSLGSPTAVTGFRDASTLLNIAMADSSDNVFFSSHVGDNGWNYGLISVTQNGITSNKRVYRSKYQLGNTLQALVS